METYNPVELAIKAVGGKSIHLSKKMNVSHQAVSFWLRKKEIPIHRIKEVARITGLPKNILRPDFFD